MRWRSATAFGVAFRGEPLLALFGAVFELLLERSELGERRIRIRFLVVADAQAGFSIIHIAVGAIDRRATVAAARSALLAVIAIVALVAFLLPLLTLLPVVTALIVGAFFTAVPTPMTPIRFLFRGRVGGGLRSLIGRCSGCRGGACILVAALRTRTAGMLRLAIGAAGGTPDLDHLRFGRCRSSFGGGRSGFFGRSGFGGSGWFSIDDGSRFLRGCRLRLRRWRGGAREEIRVRQQ
jgi:hypothetical protein